MRLTSCSSLLGFEFFGRQSVDDGVGQELYKGVQNPVVAYQIAGLWFLYS
jgi:hypothetical protein